MKSLFYCQHSIGMGHLIRTLRLAEASLEDGPVQLICGGPVPAKLKIDPRIDVVALPPLVFGQDMSLATAQSSADVSTVLRERRRRVVEVVRTFRPDALVVEMFPFGRKKLAHEIIALVTAARGKAGTRVFSSVRDVLVTKRRDQARHDRRAVGWLNEYFDAVLIHSDPGFVSLSATFSAFSDIAIPTHYTGYVSSGNAPAAAARDPIVVVSAGGGRVGAGLTEAALAAAGDFRSGLGLDTIVITGPLGRKSRRNPDDSIAQTIEYESNMPALLGRASLSISQCGYNTAADVLRARVPSVFVPFETRSEDEQLRRAELLAGRGGSIVLRESALTPATLLRAARQALAISANDDTAAPVDLNGALCSRAIIRESVDHG